MARTVSVKLMADVSQFSREIGGRATGSVRTLAGELDKANHSGKLDRVTAASAGLGIGLVGVAGIAIKMRADFEKQMSAVQAATHAGAGEMATLKQAALDAGKSTAYSATEAGKGIEELSKAGVSTANILGGGLSGALSLAAAGSLDVGEAAETAASAMTQFKLSGDQVPHIADLLAAAAGKAQGSVHDMGAALNQSGLIAASTGLTLEDTTGTLAAFASAGLVGSDAGTSFKTMLQALQAPSGKTKKLMDDLGISAYDAQGSFIGITGLAGQLKDKLAKLTPEMRANAMAQIFGSDATRAANILYEQGADGIQKWIGKVNDSGYAAETARTKTDNLAGDLERLKGSLETMAIEAGGGANSGLRVLTKTANGAVDVFSGLPGWVQQTSVVLAAVSGASLLAGSGFVKARKTGQEFLDELRNMGPAGTNAADKLGRIGSVAGKLGLAGAGAVAVYEGFKLFGDWVEKKHAPVKADIEGLTASIRDFAASGRATGELAGHYGDQLQKIGQDVSSVTKGMADLAQAQADYAAGLTAAEATENWNPVDPQAVQDIKDLDGALAGLVKSGGANQAKIFLDQLAASGRLTSGQFATLITMLPNYTAATHGATTANSGLAQGFGDTTANAKTMTSALDSAIEAGQSLTDVWKQLHGAMVSSDRAALAVKETIHDVAKSFKDNGKAVDGNSSAALRNRIAVGSAAEAAAKAAQAKYEETGSVRAASRTYQGYIADLRKTLGQSKLTKAQVDRLIDAYAKMPSDVTTKISTSGGATVAKQLTLMGQAQQALKKGTQVPAPLRNAFKFAQGGGVHGPGTDTSDDILAMLSNDEHVWTAAEVRAAGGHKRVEKLRRAALDGELPAYAGGGRVTWPYRVNVADTRVPSAKEVSSVVAPAGPTGGGMTYKWIEAAVHSRFPGLKAISDFRPGAVTLSGNRSYHAIGRAVDWPASHDLAVWWNQHYLARTKEFISPWNDLNIHNGQRHTYTGAIYRQHNFAGGNAHDHIAMAGGGVINEPVYGYGASGRSYSFGERGAETVIPGAGGLDLSGLVSTLNGLTAALSVQGGRGGGVSIGAVQVTERADVDMLVNRLQFQLGGL